MTAPLRLLARPIRQFMAVESSGGIALLVATAAALVWANSPWDGAYERIAHDVHDVVNDGLMALFFLVVGLEIKRELVTGELRGRRTAALPALAALGGMVVPALLYTAVNVGGDGAPGWGVPMATDIAFALGVVALVGPRVPPALKVFLLALAIVDDIGAIVVIAVFYAAGVSAGWLVVAGTIVAAVGVLRWRGVWHLLLFAPLAVALWLATLESGVHATLAGVVMGLLTPARETERLESALHPWTSYVVVPIFALANAGVVLGGDAIGDALGSAVTLGVVLGLVLGKVLGVTAFTWLAVRSGVGRLPNGVTWPQVAAVGLVAGIGFTVAIFVAGLAFESAALQEEAKLGILAASVVAAVGGALALRAATPQADRNEGS